MRDHVGGLDSRLCCRAVFRYHGNVNALRDPISVLNGACHILAVDSEIGGLRLRHLLPGGAVHQILDDGQGRCDGNGVTHALHLGGAVFCGVDPNHLTVHIQQRADNAGGNGLTIPQSIADGNDLFSYHKTIRISKFRSLDLAHGLLRDIG